MVAACLGAPPTHLIADDYVQISGGIEVTWEHNIHIYRTYDR